MFKYMKEIILTGDRPTGRLHIGHLFGALNARVAMQDEYETYVIVADIQALTDNFNTPEKVRQNVYEVVLDNLAAGINPKKSHIFIQSMIPEIAELTVLFSNLVTIARLQRNPTVKTELAEKDHVFKGNVTYGFLGYPISQAADILAFQANVVPAGEDQLPVIEQVREIADKFNSIYGSVFPKPRAVVFPRVKGLDGNAKMGKSLNNAIYISDSKEEIEKKVRGAVTDPQKIKKDDKGHPDVCTVYSYHKLFSKEQEPEIRANCKSGALGCADCKKRLANNIVEYLAPIQERRNYYSEHMDEVKKIVENGTKAARAKAKETMDLVRKAIGIDY